MVQCNQTKEDQMSWACGTYGGQEIEIRASVVKPKTQSDHLEDLSKDGRKIMKCILNLEGH